MSHPLIIVDYDPRWPELYEEEKKVILGVIGHKVSIIEHIGSTSVPGLGAKPIIDMMAGVDSQEDADECVSLLLDVGYDDVTPEPEEEEWFNCLGKGHRGVYHHLHLVKSGSAWFEKHILFRDFLRGNPEVAREYHELKRRLAERYRNERQSYTDAKTEFIDSIIAKAREQRTRMH